MTSVSYENGAPAGLMFGDGQPLGFEVADAVAVGESKGYIQREVEDLQQGIRAFVVADDERKEAGAAGVNDQFRHEIAQLKADTLPFDAQADIITQLQEMETDELVAFCQWHADRYEAYQAALEQSQPEIQEDTLQRISKLVDLGVYPQGAVDQFEEALTASPYIYALDSFDAGWFNADAYFMPSSADLGSIALSNMFTDMANFRGLNVPLLSSNLHESVHLMQDSAAVKNKRPLEERSLKAQSVKLVEEFFAEHQAVVGTNEKPMPDVMMGSERVFDDHPGNSRALRDLVGWLFQYGSHPVGADQLGAALLDRSAGARKWDEVISRLSKSAAHGFSGLGDMALPHIVSVYYHSPDEALASELASLLGRLQPVRRPNLKPLLLRQPELCGWYGIDQAIDLEYA